MMFCLEAYVISLALHYMGYPSVKECNEGLEKLTIAEKSDKFDGVCQNILKYEWHDNRKIMLQSK